MKHNVAHIKLFRLLILFILLSLAASATFARGAETLILNESAKINRNARRTRLLNFQQNLVDRIGRYEGIAVNSTVGQTGKVTFAITNIDRSGNATAVFSASDGLCGVGVLSGRISAQRIIMSGQLVCESYQTRMIVAGNFINDSIIEAQYTLERISAAIPEQTGKFRVIRADARANENISPNQQNNARGNAESYFNRGVELERAERYKDALEAYKQAIELNPNYAAAYYRIGSILSLAAEKTTNADEKTRGYNLAVQVYQKAIQINRNYANAYVGLANAYLQLQQYKDALAASRQAVNLAPNDFYANAILGASAYQLENFQEAINAFRNAVRIKSDYVAGYLTMSIAYSRLARYQDAIATMRQALLYDSNNSDAYVGLSWYYSLTDQPEESLDAAKNAVRIKPNEQMGYTNMCRAYVDLKQPQAALNACRQALNFKPNDPETLNYIGYAYNDLGQKQRATESFRKSATGFEQMNITDPDAYYILGNAYRQLGEYASAIRAYRRCLQLKPNFALPHLSLGLTYVLAGDKQAARNEYETLRNLDPSKAEKLLKVINGKR